MTVGKPVSSNFYPNTTNTNGVAIEPNNAKATKNEKGVALPLADADSFQSSTTPRKVATSEKAPSPPTTPQGISPLMVGAGMLTTLLVGTGAVFVAGSNNWIELGQKAKTTVTKELPDAVAKFLNVTKDATDEVTTNAIKALEKETQDLKDKLKKDPANSALQTQLDEATLRFQQASTALANEQQAHGTAKSTIAGHEGIIQDLQHEAGVKDNAISDLGNQVNEKQDEIDLLNNTIQKNGEDLAKAEQNLRDGAIKEQRLKHDLDKATREYKELQTSKNVDATTQKYMDDLKTAKEKAEQELAKLTTGNQVLIADINRLEADNKTINEVLEEANVSIYVLTEGKEKLTKELEQLKNDLAEPLSHQQSPVARRQLELPNVPPPGTTTPNLTTVVHGENLSFSLPTTKGKTQTLQLASFPPAGKTPQIETITVSQGETSTGNLGNAVLMEAGKDSVPVIETGHPSTTTGTSERKPITTALLNVEPLPLPEELKRGGTSIPITPWNGDDSNVQVVIRDPFGSPFQKNLSQLAHNRPESIATDMPAPISSIWEKLGQHPAEPKTSVGRVDWNVFAASKEKEEIWNFPPTLNQWDTAPNFATSQTPVSSASSKIELPTNEAGKQTIVEEEQAQAEVFSNQKGGKIPLRERIIYANNSQTQVEEVLAELPPNELTTTDPLPTTPNNDDQPLLTYTFKPSSTKNPDKNGNVPNFQTDTPDIPDYLPKRVVPPSIVPTTPKKESLLARTKTFVQNALGLNAPINLNDDWV
ncbi:MAG: hypothetical protein H2174_06925 [Vampirovibrio sp.]|nr:hypothetical protein [Vampirovibrio sp.]